MRRRRDRLARRLAADRSILRAQSPASDVSLRCARQRSAHDGARRPRCARCPSSPSRSGVRGRVRAAGVRSRGPAQGLALASVAALAGARIRQAPAYFDGSLTVRRRRPFLRRRLKTSRPHFVDILVLNPCFRIRRLFLGRYVGFPITTPDSSESGSKASW